MTKKVIIDTNFLLIPGQFKIDIFTQIEELVNESVELCIMSGTLDELKKLAEGKSKDSMAAKLGYVLAEQKGLKSLASSNHVDDAIVAIVDQGTIVATQDQELKKRVKEKKGQIITMRQKSHLILEE